MSIDQLQLHCWRDEQRSWELRSNFGNGELTLAWPRQPTYGAGSWWAISCCDNPRRTSGNTTNWKITILKNENNLCLMPAKQLMARSWDGPPYVVIVQGVEGKSKTNKTCKVFSMTTEQHQGHSRGERRRRASASSEKLRQQQMYSSPQQLAG